MAEKIVMIVGENADDTSAMETLQVLQLVGVDDELPLGKNAGDRTAAHGFAGEKSRKQQDLACNDKTAAADYIGLSWGAGTYDWDD